MAKYVVDEKTLTHIADSIRTKKGTSENITPENMPSEISGITTAENLDAVLTEQEELIAELQDVLKDKANSKTPTQEKTIDITGNGTHTINPDEGYALSKVTANVNVPVPEGYIIPSGTKEITENGKHDVTEYASVNVNVAGSGGGDELTELLTNKMTALDSDATSVRGYAFRGATELTSVNLPKATSIGNSAFYGCNKLTSVNMPLVNSIADSTFDNCSILPSIVLPSLTSIGNYSFRGCSYLSTVDFPKLTSIPYGSFYACYSLKTLILRSETMCTLEATSAFTNCYHFHGTRNSTYNPNGDKDGYIYVPSALVESYKSATNWSTLSTQFRAIEDYPEICGVSV